MAVAAGATRVLARSSAVKWMRSIDQIVPPFSGRGERGRDSPVAGERLALPAGTPATGAGGPDPPGRAPAERAGRQGTPPGAAPSAQAAARPGRYGPCVRGGTAGDPDGQEERQARASSGSGP